MTTSNQTHKDTKPSLKLSLKKPFYRCSEIISLEIIPDIF